MSDAAMQMTPNFPRNLAYVPPDATHTPACERVAYRAVQALIEAAGKGKWLEQLKQTAPLPCCSNPDTLDIEASYSNAAQAAKGEPDLYRFYCRTCEAAVFAGEKPGGGFSHVKFCVGGGDERPFWEVR